MNSAISVQSLSKLYRLGERWRNDYGTLREAIGDTLSIPWRRLRRLSKRPQPGSSAPRAGERLWALRDVSFEVAPGEALGVVGRNGAGKSTLLKILSGITEPSSGRAILTGRLGSLLEVGTGFHTELTGRQNIYLNGAIYGMARKEIARKFDDIVAFAQIERFIDTPVKRYSSGLYTRLAFAVASYMDQEILIVDEVLAVGDAQFQKKCLRRMSEVSRQGRTVLFVSHNMSLVKSLCTRGMLLDAGRIVYHGNIDEVVNRYLEAGTGRARTGAIPEDADRASDITNEARVRLVRLTNLEGRDIEQLYFRQAFRIGITCELMKDIEDALFEISISTGEGTHVTCSTTTDGGAKPLFVPKGTYEIWAEFDTVLLPNDYTVDVGIHHHHNGATADFVQRTLDFSVLRVAEYGGDHYRWSRTRGLVRAPARWDLQKVRTFSEACQRAAACKQL